MAHNTGIGKSKFGQAVAGVWDNTMGMGGLGITGEGGMLNEGWNAITGQIEPEDLQYANWQNQEYNPAWDTQGQTGTAQGYTGQGYTASQVGPAQGYTATQAGPAQGYTGQGYDAAMGNYQTGQDFSNILGQAMGAADQFMDPSSQWAKGQQSILAETTGQQAGQQMAQQDAMLASRGMGSGGLRNILNNQAQATAGEQQRRGATDIATTGAGLGLQA